MSTRREALEAASGGPEARVAELDEKARRLGEWLARQHMDGILVRRHENVAWATAGQVEARVGILSATGIVTLLLLRDGRRFYFAPNNEADRLAEEEFADLGYEPVVRPWYELDPVAEAKQIVATNAGGGSLCCDDAMGGLPVVTLAPLRAPLAQAELARYRSLGADTARIVSAAALALQPGVTEHDMEADVAAALLREGIFPSVLLMAVDDRVLHYRHAVARGAKLERFGMLNLCTRRWGLAVSITRFVHFGPLPAELAAGFDAAAKVNAALQHASRAGAASSTLFAVAAKAYADAGFPGEEQKHHQGGPCGYLEREWVAAPTGTQVVVSPQALAWNPSCRGGKVEDTTLLVEGKNERITATPELPEVRSGLGGDEYLSAGPLMHD